MLNPHVQCQALLESTPHTHAFGIATNFIFPISPVPRSMKSTSIVFVRRFRTKGPPPKISTHTFIAKKSKANNISAKILYQLIFLKGTKLMHYKILDCASTHIYIEIYIAPQQSTMSGGKQCLLCKFVYCLYESNCLINANQSFVFHLEPRQIAPAHNRVPERKVPKYNTSQQSKTKCVVRAGVSFIRSVKKRQ